MTPLEKQVVSAVTDHSALFLGKAVRALGGHDDREDGSLDHDIAVEVSLFLMFAMELAVKAYLIRHAGIASVVDPGWDAKKKEPHPPLTDAQLQTKFREQSIKTRRFENLKNACRKDSNPLDDDAWEQLELFQRRRNKLVHFAFEFDPGDLYDLKYDMVFVIVHVLAPLLVSGEERPSELLGRVLTRERLFELVQFEPYRDAREAAARAEGVVGTCPDCSAIAFVTTQLRCLCCGLTLESAAGVTHCMFCWRDWTVIYDKLNIDCQPDAVIDGHCLSCDVVFPVFRCARCGNVSMLHHDRCRKVPDGQWVCADCVGGEEQAGE